MTCAIVDRTELAKRPEAEARTLKLLNDLLAESVDEWAGFVYRRFDDSAIVCFEYPRALEDGPEWALRCAKSMLQSRLRNMPDASVSKYYVTGARRNFMPAR